MLGYFRIDLSAKVLSFFLVGELAIILVYDFAVAGKGGATGLGTTPFTPHGVHTFLLGLIRVTRKIGTPWDAGCGLHWVAAFVA
ncbi:hypothetical protein ACWEWX_15775 [Streptomyces asiaticus]